VILIAIGSAGGLLRSKIALVTSGVGTAQGGIGVVAQLIVSALRPDTDVSLWEHPASLPRMLRIGLTAWRAFFGGFNRPDLVVYDHVHLAALHATIPSLRAIPYAVFLHGTEVWEPLAGRRKEALLRANFLLTNSATTEATARIVNPWLPKLEIVWLGVRGQPRPTDLTATPPVGLIIGRMASSERQKGHDAVMDAWPEIRSAIPDAKLFIVGTGDDERRLRRRVRDEHLLGIEFCGRLRDAERDRMYRSSRLLFYPSRQEGFGLAAVEAASFGVPVLGLAGTVVEELFPNSTGALLARDWETWSIAQAAIPVLSDAQLARAVGVAAWTRVQNNFLEEHFTQRFRRVLAKLLPAYRSSPERNAEEVAPTLEHSADASHSEIL
jgi:phosphatidyl-myo-inositol dimannoside synthase